MVISRKISAVLLLLILSIFQPCFADESLYKGEIRYLTVNDLTRLSPDISIEEIKALFGEPLKSEGMIGWPRVEFSTGYSDIDQWKRAYWFFFKKGKSGRPKHPLQLEYVASISDEQKDVSPPLWDLIPKMTIRWPESNANQSLMKLYFGVDP